MRTVWNSTYTELLWSLGSLPVKPGRNYRAVRIIVVFCDMGEEPVLKLDVFGAIFGVAAVGKNILYSEK